MSLSTIYTGSKGQRGREPTSKPAAQMVEHVVGAVEGGMDKPLATTSTESMEGCRRKHRASGVGQGSRPTAGMAEVEACGGITIGLQRWERKCFRIVWLTCHCKVAGVGEEENMRGPHTMSGPTSQA
jgi:hypothetical protein